MIRAHDHEIISYEVNLQHSKITLHILSGNREAIPASIEFIGVLAHKFETQLPGSIILDIRSYEISRFLEYNKELLDEQKKYSWPLHYETLDDLHNHLQSENYAFYVISASYGLNGWVVAKEHKVFS